MVKIYRRRSASMYSGARPKYRGGVRAYNSYNVNRQIYKRKIMNYYRKNQPRGNLRKIQLATLKRQRAAKIIQRRVRNYLKRK